MLLTSSLPSSSSSTAGTWPHIANWSSRSWHRRTWFRNTATPSVHDVSGTAHCPLHHCTTSHYSSGRHQFRQFQHPVGVTPFVVVPGQDLDHVGPQNLDKGTVDNR